MTKTIDILAIGNALMDIIAPVPEVFLHEQGIGKGARYMIDEDRANDLTPIFLENKASYFAGGTGANTLVGAAGLGASTAYIGCVDDDLMGRAFEKDLVSSGVRFLGQSNYGHMRTGRCLIAVTPDAERSMNTYLGAGGHYDGRDFKAEDFAASKIVLLVGYLLDAPDTKAAMGRAIKMAKAANCQIALTLSDHLCVARHQEAFRELIANDVDIVLSNQAEMLALYDARDIDDVIFALSETGITAVITQGARGSVIVKGQYVQAIKVHKIPKCIDTTGAGDQYAAGFLTGLARGESLKDCGDQGAVCASNVITHFGARPESTVPRVKRLPPHLEGQSS